MSQHDFDIANQGFAAFRTDLNNALQALGSLSSGTTAPATTYANQLWYETDTDTLWLRNEANSAWLSVMVINQSTGALTLSFADGTAALPSIAHAGDLNAGIFFPAADTVAVSTSSTERLRITTSGLVGIGTTPAKLFHVYRDNTDQDAQVQIEQDGSGSPVLGFLKTGVSAWLTGLYNSDDSYRIAASGADLNTNPRLVITTAGNVGIGTTSPPSQLTVAGAGQLVSGLTDAGAKTGTMQIHSTSGASGAGGALLFSAAASNGATSQWAIKSLLIDGTANGLGDLVISGRTATADTALTERMRIAYSGTVMISNLAGAGSRAVNASAAGVLSAASDSRLKQEVPEASIAGLAEIMQLRPVAYKWLDDIANRGDEAAVELGFFADEAKDIIPSAAPMGNDGYYGFYDRAVIAALTKAVQEQQAIILALEARLTAANL